MPPLPTDTDERNDMTTGGNADNVEYRQDVLKRRLDDGQCTYCPPHRGENEKRGSRHGVWRDRTFIESKGKDKK